MASFNRVILLGNLTRDVEVKYTPSGLAVTDIGLAVNDKRKNQAGEWVEETTFVDITLWGRTAEIASEYLGKGSQVMIEGRLKLDTWETEGQKRSKLRVVGERMQMVGSKGGGGGGGGSRGGGSSSGQPQYDESESFGGEPASMGPPRGQTSRQAAAPPPGDDIPF